MIGQLLPKGLIFSILLSLIVCAPCFGSEQGASEANLLRTATKVAWPEKADKHAYELLLERFSIQINTFPKRVSTVRDRVIISGQDGSVIHVDPVTLDDLVTESAPQGLTFSSRYSVSDFGKLPFIITVKDSPPGKSADLRVWKDAMEYKKEIFGKSNEVLMSQKGNLEIYYFISPVPPDGNYAYIHDSRRPEIYLQVFGKNMSFDLFKQILGSTTLMY